MSHFIISSNSVIIFGTPNGQASTQLLQAMQRGLRAVCTTPSPVRLMASAGQTSAQVGESQCMQTTGTVCDAVRAVDVLQVDHRVPLVRVALGAGVDARLAADAAARVDEELQVVRLGHRAGASYCCGSSSPRTRAAPSALRRRQPHDLVLGIFEIGSCAAIVSRLTLFAPGPVVRDEHRVRADRRHHLRPQRDRAAPRSRPSPSRRRRCRACSARRGWISTRGSGYWSTSGPMRRVWVPDRNWLTTRPVVRMTGSRRRRPRPAARTRRRGSGPCRRGSRTGRRPSHRVPGARLEQPRRARMVIGSPVRTRGTARRRPSARSIFS